MSSQPEWLIRSGSRVLGPYTQAEVLLKLREKELSLHDEVSEPLGRWWPIQFHPRMDDVVEDFRSQSANERTDAIGTGTPTVSLTDALGEASSQSKKKVESKAVETFGVYKHSQQNKAAKSFYGWLWLVCFLVFLGGAYYFWSSQKNKNQQVAQVQQASDLKKAEQALYIGDYKQALELYKKISEKNPSDHSYAVFLAPLYLQDKNQTVMAKREFENIPNLGQSAEMMTAYGLMYFLDGNDDKALENWKKAMSINPHFEASALNIAYLYIHNKSPSRSREWIEANYQREGYGPDWNIAYALASVDAFEKTKSFRFLSEAKLMLSGSHLKVQDRLQDVLLIRMRLSRLMNDDEAFKKNLADFFNQEIDGFKKVRHNAFVANRFIEDEFMVPLCRKNAASISTQPEKGLLEVYCFVRGDQMDLAQKKISQMREQMPKHVSVLAWSSFMLNQLRQQDEASVLLGRALEANRNPDYILPATLQAQFCFDRKDYTCAEQNWVSVLKNNSDSLVALTGLASVKVVNGRKTEALEDLKRIALISDDYKPFLQLRWKEKEGEL